MQLSVLVARICMMSNGMLLFLQSSSTSCKKDCPTVFFNVSGRNPYSSAGSKGCICCSRIYSIRVKQCLFLSVRSIMSVLLWYFCRIYYYYFFEQFLLNYCSFHKHANSEVQKPTDDCIFRCCQSS